MKKELIDEIRKESCLFNPDDPECSSETTEKYAEQIQRDIESPPTIEIIKYELP